MSQPSGRPWRNRPQCKGCKAIIRWINMESGKAMPVDPEKYTEWLTQEAITTSHRVSVVTPDGKMVTGYIATILTPGASSVEGFRPHWASCPKAKEFGKGGALR